ncbi:hypothetical protein P1X15_17220 [Runella sp. MFBS21]|uniref:hypothetical protein n=1 Tax=Runella sp. MFBS21 TaxID=3034018 RepID=UPI0023F816FF|nr:hypothetical protein [Runella sp. MFBS21]MDF7819362.1 hypothetical protein [Runella sp. MFBS21]
MTQEEYCKDYKIVITNTLRGICLWIKENGVFEETSGWLIKYGKYNLEAVDCLKKNKIYTEEEFEILDKITEMMEYYEDFLGNIDDIQEATRLNYLTEQDQVILEQLVNRFLSLQINETGQKEHPSTGDVVLK